MLRTPPKSCDGDNSPSKTEEAAANVRRSIGEWEANTAGPSPLTAGTTTRTSPEKRGLRLKMTLSQDNKKAARKITAEAHTPPKQYTSRSAEAKACLCKAKLHLNSSKNTRTDIKVAIIEALDRLFELVKEAEKELKTKEKEPAKKIDPETAVTDSTFLVGPDPNKMSLQLEEHSKLLIASTEMMRQLQETMANQADLLEKEKEKTYASVVTTQNASAQPNRSTLHSVVIASKNESEAGDDVLEKVRKVVDAKEGWVKVEKVRKAKDGKIIMGFRTEEERNKVKDRLGKDGIDLTVEEVKNKDPLLILKDVLLANTDEDVLKAFRNQNRSIFHNLNNEEDRIELKYRRRARNPHTGHIVVSVSPTIWRRVNDLGYVHIDLQRIKVEDQSPLVQCTRCLGYGHSKRFCKEPADLCGHCGGPHLRTECAEWLAGATPSCRNCTKAKQDHVGHNAFSPECPIRRKWDKLARSSVAYC